MDKTICRETGFQLFTIEICQ